MQGALRQAIINTHSPVVVALVPHDAVVFAIPQQQAIAGAVLNGVSFRSLAGTCRSYKAQMPVVARGKALAFLSPIAEPRDPRRKAGEWRVVDREDMQLSLDLWPNGRMPQAMPGIDHLKGIADPNAELYALLRPASGLTGWRLKRFNPGRQALRLGKLIEDYGALRRLPAFRRLEQQLGGWLMTMG